MDLIFTYLISCLSQLCEQRRLRRACAPTENRQRLNCPQTHRRNACPGCEFKISKALEMMGTSRNSLCLPHVCRCTSMYPDFVTCEDQSAHRTALSALLFLEQNIKHFVGPDLGPTLSQPLWGGGGGGGAGPGTANSISRRQRDRVMVHGHGLRSKKPTIRPRVVVVVLRLG